ncbi:MAG: NAD(P)/FAD-dependent oxidoreductase [Anaerolineales bacterium]|nr:NAD(P)/FAD-dependent oxidoreductase [Anaerolineales bacterium]
MNIAVLGAGIGGMAAAYDLIKAGHQVTIYEAEDYVGGLAAGFKEPHWDWSLERYYHHWFASDRHMLGLIRELGWQDKVIFPRPYTVMYHNGRFYPLDSVMKAILFPGLGFGVRKARFGLVTLYLRLSNNWKALEQYTVDQWMRKWGGDQNYEMMWKPLVVGKFGEKYAKEVNMAWMWARLKARTTRLGTFQGGFQAFADRFADKLKSMGVTINLSTPVSSLIPFSEGGISLASGQGAQRFDQALVTSSPAILARLAPQLPTQYLQGLLELKSMGAVVMVAALSRQLSREGYYWYNLPKSAGFPFLALVEHTNYLPPEHYGGDHLIYMGDYLNTDHEYFELPQDELLKRFMPSLSRINPDFNPDWVRKSWLWRTRYAQPVPFANHSQNIPSIDTPISGLFFASMSQVYPWDRGTNFAVEIGRRAARIMMDSKK